VLTAVTSVSEVFVIFLRLIVFANAAVFLFSSGISLTLFLRMLWLKITPTYQIMKDDDVWEEKYSSDTSARRKITVWIDNQRTRSVVEHFMLK